MSDAVKTILDDGARAYWRSAGRSQARFLSVLLANAPQRSDVVNDQVLAALFKHTTEDARRGFGMPDEAADEVAAAMVEGFDAEYEAIRALAAATH